MKSGRATAPWNRRLSRLALVAFLTYARADHVAPSGLVDVEEEACRPYNTTAEESGAEKIVKNVAIGWIPDTTTVTVALEYQGEPLKTFERECVRGCDEAAECLMQMYLGPSVRMGVPTSKGSRAHKHSIRFHGDRRLSDVHEYQNMTELAMDAMGDGDFHSISFGDNRTGGKFVVTTVWKDGTKTDFVALCRDDCHVTHDEISEAIGLLIGSFGTPFSKP